MDYTPSKTCRDFMVSDSLVKCIVGPLGSGKSYAGIMELFRRAVEQEPDEKGVRPTRFVVVRNTLSMLIETFLADCQSYLSDFFTWKAGRKALEFRFSLPDGTTVHSDWLLLPLERPEDARRLLSLNLTSALIEECREVNYDVVAALMGRIGRYPAMTRVPPTWTALMLISNPWSESSSYHDHFVLDRPDDWELYVMPGGLDPDAENVEFLPERYYERLMDGHSDEWIKVHVHGLWGDDQFGMAVYKSSYDGSTHINEDIVCNPMLPLILGIDFGRTPAVVITQQDVHGRLLVLEEITSEDMGLRQFCEYLLLPTLRGNYAQNRVFVVGDPAGRAKSQYSEETAYDVLEEFGLDCVPAPTNDPAQRLRAVEKNLLATRAGEAGFLMSAEKCPVLARGFQRDYRYRKKRDGELTPVPDKNDASHIHDALQYACLGHESNYVGRRVMLATQPHVIPRRPKFSSRAWT